MKHCATYFLTVFAFWMPLAVFAAHHEGGGSKVGVKGHFRYRFEYRNNTGYLAPKPGLHLIRLRPNVTFTPNNHFNVVLEPQLAKRFSQANGGVATSGGVTDDNFLVHQAYLDYHPIEELNVFVGRQELNYGDQLIISPLGWNNISRSFDALRVRLNSDWGTSDVFYSKLNDNSTTNRNDDDLDFWGFYNSFSAGDYIKEWDLYLLFQSDTRTFGATDTWTAGTRLKSKIGMFDYRAEAGFQFGKNVSEAYQGDLELGYTFDEAHKLRLAAEGFIAGENYNQHYPLAHAFLGLADLVGRKNLVGFKAKLSSKISGPVSGMVQFHMFSRKVTTKAAATVGGGALGTGAGSSKAIASEVDLLLKVKATDGLTIVGGPFIVLPGQYLKDQTGFGSKTSIFAFLQATAKF